MSITLTNPTTLSINGLTVESDANAALTYMEVVYPTQVRLFYSYGSTSGQVFTPGSTVGKVIVTVNLVTGAWTSTSGTSGTMSGAGLTALQNAAINLQNAFENFAVNNSIIAGTQVAWTTAEV